MTIGKLNKLCKKYNIPNHVILQSDSGWECNETEMDGVYYNKKENRIVFTQYFDEYDRDYYNNENWIMLEE